MQTSSNEITKKIFWPRFWATVDALDTLEMLLLPAEFLKVLNVYKV